MAFLLVAASLVGRVVDRETGDPVVAAVIRAPGVRATTTDEDGFFRLRGLSPGRYLVVVSQIGYRPETLILTTESFSVIKLRPSAITTREIEVSGERARFQAGEPSPVSLPLDVVLRVPTFLGRDLFRVVQVLPGVSAPSDYTSALYVRGSSPADNLILLDGAPVLNPFHFGGLFSAFIPEVNRDPQIWLGGFPARFGGRLSSVMQVESEPPGNPALSYDLSLLGVSAALRTPWFVLGARRTYFDKVLPLFGVEFPYHFWDLQARAFVGPWGYTHYHTGDLLHFSPPSYPSYWFDVSWGNSVNILDWRSLRGDVLLGAELYQSFFKMDFADPYELFKNRVCLNGFRASAESEVWALGLAAETEGFYYHYDVGQYEFNFEKYPWMVGVWTEAKLRAGKLVIRPGLRADYYRGFSDFLGLDPRLWVKYFLSDQWALLGAFGVFHEYDITANSQEDVMPLAFFWLPLLPGQTPQLAYHGIVGIERWLATGTTARLEIYYKWIPVSWDYAYYYQTEPGSEGPEDWLLSRGYATGADLLYMKSAGRIRGYLGYSFCYAMRHRDDIGWFFPSYEKRHQAKAGVVFTSGPWSLSAQLSLTSGTPYTGRAGRARWGFWVGDTLYSDWRSVWGKHNSLRYPPYRRVDLSLGRSFWVFGSRAEVILSVINVFDFKNVFFYYYDYETEPPTKHTFWQFPRILSVEVRGRLP